MNATLELDDDVLANLRMVMKKSGRSLGEVVNGLLRGAFEGQATTSAPPQRKPFVVAARPMGVHEGLDYSRIGDLLEHLEGPEYR